MPPRTRTRTIVADIRGGHGSGKTTIVKQLAKMFGWEDGPVKGTKVMPRIDALVLQPDPTFPGQGPKKEWLSKVIEQAPSFKRFIIEGVVSSHTRGRYVEMARSPLYNYHFLFLDTPLEMCIERVLARRKAFYKDVRYTKPFDPKNVVKEYHSAMRVRDVLRAEGGLQVIDLDHTDPLPATLSCLAVLETVGLFG